MDDFMGEKRIMVRRWNRTKKKREKRHTHTRSYGLFGACSRAGYLKHIKHLASFIFVMYKFSFRIEINSTTNERRRKKRTHTHITYLHITFYRNTINQMLFEGIHIKSEAR